MTRTQRSGAVAALALFLASACSSARPPTETLATADVALRRAEESLAAEYAPLELVTAREKLDEARSEMAKERYDQARRHAEQALVDAKLAEEKAQAAKAKRDAEEMARSVELLKDEVERRSAR